VNAPGDPAIERLHPMPVIEPASSTGDEAREGHSRVGLTLDYIKAHRRVAGLVLLVAAIVGSATALLLPSTYTARASFYSEGKQAGDLSSLSALGPLSALMNMAGGSLGGNQSTLFVDLLKSQDFFDSLAVSRISVRPNAPPMLKSCRRHNCRSISRRSIMRPSSARR